MISLITKYKKTIGNRKERRSLLTSIGLRVLVNSSPFFISLYSLY